MFEGQKVGVRKSVLQAYGGDLKNQYDSHRLDSNYYRKHRGINNPHVPEGTNLGGVHLAPAKKDILGFSRYAGHLCGKDYAKDYRPWRNNLPLREICVLPEPETPTDYGIFYGDLYDNRYDYEDDFDFYEYGFGDDYCFRAEEEDFLYRLMGARSDYDYYREYPEAFVESSLVELSPEITETIRVGKFEYDLA